MVIEWDSKTKANTQEWDRRGQRYVDREAPAGSDIIRLSPDQGDIFYIVEDLYTFFVPEHSINKTTFYSDILAIQKQCIYVYYHIELPTEDLFRE